jgi:hypothetical protein
MPNGVTNAQIPSLKFPLKKGGRPIVMPKASPKSDRKTGR